MAHRPKKFLGQNFLIDQQVCTSIATIVAPDTTDVILEIGAGLGALTKHILKYKPHKLHLIEIDRDLIDYLHNNYSQPDVIVHGCDALTFNYTELGPVRLVGNLPYNISTPLLFYLSNFNNIRDMHFMLQKEVVERICAPAGCKSYGRLSIMLQCRYNCTSLLDIKRDAFKPKPNVDSAILGLKPRVDKLWELVNPDRLKLITTNAFNKRRKMLSNSLHGIVDIDTLKHMSIDNVRAEDVTVESYAQLSLSK
jgi:16S rRNA (adenine1518-N6/adenine1519-N6)-dimethyltransferase